MQRFGKRLVGQSGLLRKQSERSQGLMAPGHPPADTHPPVGTHPSAGTALKGPLRQVRSTHEHMQAPMGTAECLSACIYLLCLTTTTCFLGVYYTPDPGLVTWDTSMKKPKTCITFCSAEIFYIWRDRHV